MECSDSMDSNLSHLDSQHSPSAKVKDTLPCSKSVRSSSVLSQLMPSLACLEPTKDALLESQFGNAIKQVNGLKVMVNEIPKAIALLHQQIDSCYSVDSENLQGLALQEVDASANRLESLCELLSACTTEFSDIMLAGKQCCALQVENKELLMEVEMLKDLHYGPEAEQHREQPTLCFEDKDAQLAQLNEDSSKQLQWLVQDKGTPLKDLALDSGTNASQLDQHDSDKVLVLERELAQAQKSEHAALQHLRALEEKHIQLIFECSNVTQSASFYSQELGECEKKLKATQKKLSSLQTQVGNYQQKIYHLEEQLCKLNEEYGSPGSSTLVSPMPPSCRLSNIHHPEDLHNILSKIRDLHNYQQSNICALLEDYSSKEFEFMMDIQLELKDLDLQATLALDYQSSKKRTDRDESSAHFPTFTYSKPYKEMYRNCCSEVKNLQFLLNREASFRPGFVCQS
ncbi:hypothetical protein DSO57_1035328 [Entomophthora muscae]|uniref:Uncharacterized protein n=1 Tax=Entomophthora muscae TaxID=34485 RepID=A0ACC2TAE3_9FUNG|nr:hypothetical protein DSO57_1035328 [Entomophthora muscae]